jgi:DNA-binding SARP family transcriptional activator
MDFRVLGQLEVWRDGECLPLGSLRQRSLLALLLMHPNQTVSADHIIDELWGEDAAADRHNALWVQVSKLRSTIESARRDRADGGGVVTRAPGYVLQVDGDDVDARRFEQRVVEARALVESDPAAASAAASEGLALWRGRPYEDFAYESFAQAEIARLDELRLEAVGLRLDAELRRGQAGELVSELQSLVRQHPAREQFTAQLMLALHRSGRRAESLRAYGGFCSRLGEELGLEPSAALQRLEAQIIRGDPELDRSTMSPGRPGRLAVRGYELREQIHSSSVGVTYRAYQPTVGREVAVTVIGPERANDPSFIRRFQADAEMAARLEHPNIVPLYDFWREPDGAFLVTRLFHGGTLEDSLRAGPLTGEAAATIVVDVASALTVAHRCGVVHGRVEPGVIQIDESGRGYLGGFGGAPSDGADAEPTSATDVHGLGVLLARSLGVLSGTRPHALSPPLPAPLAAVVERATAEEPADRFDDAASLADALRHAIATSAKPPDPVDAAAPVNPYKGLQAFGEVDAADFFGRERLVERLLARLGTGGTVGRFVAVIGPSGSGKSSAVGAGLVPAVRAGALPESEDWFIARMTPGRHPYEGLAEALRAIAVEPPADLVEALADGPGGISHCVRRVLPDERSQLLLVVDQFEEVFTGCEPPTSSSFLDALTTAVEDRQGRVRVVVTLRADFYDRPLRHRGLGELLRRGTEPITAMSPEELQRAIEQPAARAGVHFEAGLVAAMVADVADHPGALPLLQYALTELFERRRGRMIELSSYRELGGAAGALVHRAEAAYCALDDASQPTVRQVMLRLVDVGDGDSDEVTRRRVLREELLGLGAERVDPLLDALAGHRLLAFDRDPATRSPTVEIAHEALFAEWLRLQAWIADCRLDVRKHRRLAAAAEAWRTEGLAPDDLLRGTRLDELVAFSRSSDITLTPPERAFLDASVAQREVEREREREQRERVARLRRAGRRSTALLGAGAVVLAAVAVLAVIAVVRRADGDPAAEIRRLAASSTETSRDDPELAMLLALQSLATSAEADLPAPIDAELALHWAIQAAGLTYPVADGAVEVRAGPAGSAGIFRIPLEDLVGIARDHVRRGFTTDECSRFSIDPCPPATRGLASPASSGPAPIPTSTRSTGAAAAAGGLAGTTVTVLNAYVWDDQPALEAELAAFEQATGIDVRYLRPEGGEPDVDREIGGHRPDITLWPAPGGLNELAEQGRLVDLSTYLDEAAVRDHVGNVLASPADARAGFHWLPVYLDLKGLVWYPRREFEETGYQVPSTWDELVALSARMVTDGRTPWCLGLNQGSWTGELLTEWIEVLLLRTAGAETYDRWARHEIPLDHPDVLAAAKRFAQILTTDGFVEGGPQAALRRFEIIEELRKIDDDPPGCWMYFGWDLSPELFPPGTELGTTMDYFVLPPLAAGDQPPTFLGGLMAGARADRPEVRALMRYIVDPRGAWGTIGGSALTANFIPARTDRGAAICHASGATPEANVVRVRLCGEVRDALASGNWRLDASDQMPGAIGSFDEHGRVGALREGLVEWVERGTEDLDQILAEIEATWP